MKLLVITGSVNDRNGNIASSTLSALKLKDNIKKDFKEVEIIDLNNSEFATNMLNSNTFDQYFKNSEEWIFKLKNTDFIIFATSMTNFGYTAVVKNFIDKICLAKQSFKYKYDGSGLSKGLITRPKIQIITSQGAPKGWYPFGDHTTQLKGTFEFLGMNVLEPIIIHGTKTPKNRDKSNSEIVETIELNY